MTGVEILATEEVVIACAFNWLAFWKFVGVFVGVGLTVGAVVSIISGDPIALVAFFIAGIIVGLFFGAMIGIEEGNPYRIRNPI